MCPNCCQVVHKAPLCNHMMCTHCNTLFCIWCREKIFEGELEHDHKDEEDDESVLNEVTEKHSLIASILLFLYILFIPLIAVFIVPYIVGINIYDRFVQKLNMEDGGANLGEQQSSEMITPSSIKIESQNNSSTIITKKLVQEQYNNKVKKCYCKAVLFGIIAACLTVVAFPFTSVGLFAIGMLRFISSLLNY